ncbi:MAG TPA: hypothetical protein VG325_16435 [Solirubrobacteraceae bacterium]|jgi:threonine dehydrogenase-like Zn-dependent dehydrogenase|nr:hypothetical protein [Solirubrobacteraceae bacterium]
MKALVCNGPRDVTVTESEMAGLGPVETVVIHGAGSVGLMAAHSSAIRNASMIMVLDFGVSHELPLNEAPEAYPHFDSRDNGLTKVVLAPGKTSGRTAVA